MTTVSSTDSKNDEASRPSLSEAADHLLSKQEGEFKPKFKVAPIQAACRAALVKSPAASRAALQKHHASIEPALARLLGIVGSYADEEIHSPLYESLIRGDAPTVEYLIAAGAYTGPWDKVKTDGRLLDLAANASCRAIVKKYMATCSTLQENPTVVTLAAAEHCVNLSEHDKSMPLKLPLKLSKTCHITALATCLDLTTMARAEMLGVLAHRGSPSVKEWVHELTAAAVAKRIYSKALLDATSEGDTDAVEILLQAGADKDHRNIDDEDGNTALLMAAKHGHADVLKLLLEAGADANIENEYDYTALTMASQNRYPDIVELLLQAGANKDHKDSNGYTALIYAAESNCAVIAQLLLEAGANTDAQDVHGETALMKASRVASRVGDTVILDLLLKAGAFKHAVNSKGSTALAIAKRYSRRSEVIALLEPRTRTRTRTGPRCALQ